MTKLEEEELYYDRLFDSLSQLDEGMLTTAFDKLTGTDTLGKALSRQLTRINKSITKTQPQVKKLREKIEKNQKALSDQGLINILSRIDLYYEKLNKADESGKTLLQKMKEITNNISTRNGKSDHSLDKTSYDDINKVEKDLKSDAKNINMETK